MVSSVSELLQMEMQAVIDIAKELVDKNKIVNMERIFNAAKRRLKLNPEGLKKILKYLFENQILVEGSKIIKSEVLSNELRDLIYKFIQKYPGVNFSALKNNLLSEFDRDEGSIGTGQMLWHIEVLMKFGCIKRIKFKNYTLFCPYNMEPEHAISYFLLRDKINRKIIELLIENERLKQADIPKIINELKGSVYYHVTTMKDEKLLFSEKKSSALEVSINPEKRGLLIEVISDVENKLSHLKEKYPDAQPKTKEKVEEKVKEADEKTSEDIEVKEKPVKKEKKKEPRERIKTI